MVNVGEKAPDFVLKDHKKNEVKLSSLKGKRVLLSFHPLAWTKVCADQMKSLEANSQVFEELGVIALGVSVDTVPSKNAWAKELNIEKTQLLSDFWPHGAVAGSYGLFKEKEGFSERANIIIDENQTIVFVKIYEISQLPDINEIVGFFRK
ncbi:MAG: redoxin domain-containing protein [candidate division WOR-3 bacterium]|nr:MAG: redoxin domain-containing protein [candidate division WOR-3 bacterium]